MRMFVVDCVLTGHIPRKFGTPTDCADAVTGDQEEETSGERWQEEASDAECFWAEESDRMTESESGSDTEKSSGSAASESDRGESESEAAAPMAGAEETDSENERPSNKGKARAKSKKRALPKGEEEWVSEEESEDRRSDPAPLQSRFTEKEIDEQEQTWEIYSRERVKRRGPDEAGPSDPAKWATPRSTTPSLAQTGIKYISENSSSSNVDTDSSDNSSDDDMRGVIRSLSQQLDELDEDKALATQGSAQKERASAAGAGAKTDEELKFEAPAAEVQPREEAVHAAGAKRSRDEQAPAAKNGNDAIAAGAEERRGKLGKSVSEGGAKQKYEALAAEVRPREEAAHADGAKRSRDEQAPAAKNNTIAAGAEERRGKLVKSVSEGGAKQQRKRNAESDSEVSAEAGVGGEDKRHKKMETAGDDAAEGSDAAQTAEPQPPKKEKC